MTQGVQDLIKAIDSGDSQAIDAAFQAEMANRISTRLEDLRVSVAKGMFATEQATEETPEETEEIEEELTLEDYSIEEIERFMQTEDFEQLDELSKKSLGSYVNKAAASATMHAQDYEGSKEYPGENELGDLGNEKHWRKMNNRLTGIAKAAKKLAK